MTCEMACRDEFRESAKQRRQAERGSVRMQTPALCAVVRAFASSFDLVGALSARVHAATSLGEPRRRERSAPAVVCLCGRGWRHWIPHSTGPFALEQAAWTLKYTDKSGSGIVAEGENGSQDLN
jgi:hypothetical protein